MCDAVLRFSLSQSVTHLSILSKEQMKKKVLRLLPITVALHAHPEGNTSCELEYHCCLWNLMANSNCIWHSLTSNAWGLSACLPVDTYTQCLQNRSWPCPTSFLKIICFSVGFGKGVHPEICKSYVLPAKYPVSLKTIKTFHVVKGGPCSRDFRRSPRQFAELLC